MKGLIVKLQRPLASNEEGHPGFMAYDETRSKVNTVLPYHDSIAKLFKQGEAKVYHRAALVPDGKGGNLLELGERVPEQVW